MKNPKTSLFIRYKIVVLMIFLLALSCDAPKTTVQTKPETTVIEKDEMMVQNNRNPGYILTDSVRLAVEEFSVVDNLAKGIKTRGEITCVFLNVKGLKLDGGVNVSFDVFINKTDANPETGIESPHYVETVSIGHHEKSETSFDLKISLKKAIEKLGASLVNDLNSGKLYITMVAFPYTGNLEDLKNVSFSVEQFSISVDCD